MSPSRLIKLSMHEMLVFQTEYIDVNNVAKCSTKKSNATTGKHLIELVKRVDILSFDTFKEASEENPSAADVLTATAKLQDTLVQGGNLIGGATGKSLQEGSDAVMDAIAQQVKAGNNVDLDSKDSLKGLITEAASTSGANLTEAQTDGAASSMEASSKAQEDARAARKDPLPTLLFTSLVSDSPTEVLTAI